MASIAQKPNKALISSIITFAGSQFFRTRLGHNFGASAFIFSALNWSWREATKGTNVFRKMLGLGGLAATGFYAYKQLKKNKK